MTRTYKKFPYRTEYPGSSERGRSTQSLEDALRDARWAINAVWRETNPHGKEGEYLYPDAERAVITNRNTGYRWILRRRDWRVEFQTAEMFEEAVGREGIDLYLSVEEAEALARAAMAAEVKDKRQKALRDQALDQIGFLCRRMRARVRAADEFIDLYGRGIPRRPSDETEPEPHEPEP